MQNAGSGAKDTLIRVVASTIPELVGKELVLGTQPVTIGRADDCSLTLSDRRVSRKHACVEPTAAGYRVADAGSANGVWVDEQRVVEFTLTPGARFRVGGTVFEFVAPSVAAPAPAPSAPQDDEFGATVHFTRPAPGAPPPPAPAPPLPAQQDLILRVVSDKAGEGAGKEYRFTNVAIVGRDDDCNVVLRDPSVSRHHARLEAAAGARLRVVDLGSANGVWIDDRRVGDENVALGQRFRLGDVFLECHAPAPAEAGPAATRIMSDLGNLLAKVAARQLEMVGEPVAMSGSRVILLDDPSLFFYIVSGRVEIFTVTVKDGRPLGARSHFLTLNAGDAFFGVDVGFSQQSGFLAVGKTGTEVRRAKRAQLQTLANDAHVAAQIARILETWVGGLSARLTRDIFPRPEANVRLEAGQSAALAVAGRARAATSVVWLPIETAGLLYIGMSPLAPEGGPLLFPMTPQSWLELTADQGATTIDLAPVATLGAFKRPEFWAGFDYFHQVLSECEFINKRLAVVDEFQRLDKKARQSEAAREAAYDAIGAVLAGSHTEPSEAIPAGQAEPAVEACRLVGQALGIKIKAPPEARGPRSLEDHVHAVASASRFRTRRVALRGDWWKRDQGPFLARIEQGSRPVALLPAGTHDYVLVDPTTQSRESMTPELAATLAPFGYVFYRPFTVTKMRVIDVLRFGARGLRTDMWTLLAMGVVTGILGTATPYLTGQMIDSAIPQGDRSLLMQLGLGMLLAAVATAAFKVTQSIAVVRVESRMDYSLQAALWDRLLDLPSEFFRRFGAGDLAERASGVNTIRGLVSRAGVTGILGSLSSLAYVVLMLTYNVKLSLIAMGITLVLVSFTTLGNYAQLRFQRNETAMRGQISSLVLQLIAGVAKVRVSAAENHAFRVWAQRFSSQKTLGFSIGQIQNVVATFSSAFTVLSSLGIFGALFYFQASAMPGEPPPFTTGEFIAFNAAFTSFVAAMQSLADASLSLLRAVPVFERLKPILTTAPESDESKAHPGRLKGELSVSHLSFRYHEGSPLILKDVTFKIEPGQFVAFVGSSGCGKSTLMRLLLGFEKPGLGSLYYDGQDLSTLDLRSVRQQLGVVLQESRVLPTDIYRNIVGTTSHTMEEAWEAAEMAGLAEDVRQMPMGMHTVVSEGGGTFSGGQRQRLLIARALVNKPRIIFFDEATSALDNRTQSLVTQSMDRLDATRIVIAHRLSTIVNADRIFYLEGGQVKEEGTYQALMDKGGLFAELARRQIA